MVKDKKAVRKMADEEIFEYQRMKIKAEWKC
jgi:hypothetical protein